MVARRATDGAWRPVVCLVPSRPTPRQTLIDGCLERAATTAKHLAIAAGQPLGCPDPIIAERVAASAEWTSKCAAMVSSSLCSISAFSSA